MTGAPVATSNRSRSSVHSCSESAPSLVNLGCGARNKPKPHHIPSHMPSLFWTPFVLRNPTQSTAGRNERGRERRKKTGRSKRKPRLTVSRRARQLEPEGVQHGAMGSRQMNQQAPPRASPRAGRNNVVTVDGQGKSGRRAKKKIFFCHKKWRGCFQNLFLIFCFLTLKRRQILQQSRLPMFRESVVQTACERDRDPGELGRRCSLSWCVDTGEFILAETGESAQLTTQRSSRAPAGGESWVCMEPPKMRRRIGHSNT